MAIFCGDMTDSILPVAGFSADGCGAYFPFSRSGSSRIVCRVLHPSQSKPKYHLPRLALIRQEITLLDRTRPEGFMHVLWTQVKIYLPFGAFYRAPISRHCRSRRHRRAPRADQRGCSPLARRLGRNSERRYPERINHRRSARGVRRRCASGYPGLALRPDVWTWAYGPDVWVGRLPDRPDILLRDLRCHFG